MMPAEEPFRQLVDTPEVLPILRGRPWLTKRVGKLLGLNHVNVLIRDSCAEAKGDALAFAGAFLRRAEVSYSLEGRDLSVIPQSGGTLVVSNHPYGGADAIALLHFCLRARPDTMIFGNRLLNAVPSLRPCLLPLEIMTGEASHANGTSIRRAVAHLRRGGLVVIFPAGTVSHFRWKSLSVEDAPWPPLLGAIVRLSRARVLPVAFVGRNSLLFQMLGTLHPDIRTAMLPREYLRLRSKTVRLVPGDPIDFELLESKSDCVMSSLLRARVEALRSVE